MSQAVREREVATTITEVWERALGVLERDPQISRASYAAWLKGTRLLTQDGARFTIGARHSFAREKLQTAFGAAVARALGEVTGLAGAEVSFVVPGAARSAGSGSASRPLPMVRSRGESARSGAASVAAPAASHNDGTRALSSTHRPALPAAQTNAVAPAPATAEPLNARFTFASFVASPGTHFALTAARAVAENPVLAYNPFLVYGAAGLGKTHLLHAIGSVSRQHRPSLRVTYLPASKLLDALDGQSDRAAQAALVARLAAEDILLLDDTHELAGSAAQKQVLHLFEALISGGKQVVCASDTPPRIIAGLDERLRVFLQSGLVAEVTPPDDEARVAILRAKAEVGTGSARAPRRRPTPQDVLRAVSLVFGVPLEALAAPRRDRKVVVPRHVAMYLMRAETGASLAEIGAVLGGRDHSTVLHGSEKIAREIEVDGKLRELVAAVREVLAASVTATVSGPAAAAHLDSISAARVR